MSEIVPFRGKKNRTAPQMRSAFEDLAQQFLDRNIAVFPIAEDAKVPLTNHGFKDASVDAKQIRKWGKQFPDSNLGIPTGKVSNLVIIDLDRKNEKDGVAAFRKLCKRLGIKPPKTYKLQTPSGGRHLYFKSKFADEIINSVSALGDGIDIRSEGGYAVGERSEIDGNRYSCISGNLDSITTLPGKLRREIQKTKPKKQLGKGKEKTKIAEGERNDTLFRAACAFRAAGHNKTQVSAFVARRNLESCDLPLSPNEIEKIVANAFTYATPAIEAPEKGFSDTDLANAAVFVADNRDSLKYCDGEGWAHYNNVHWKLGAGAEANEAAKETVLARLDELKETASDQQPGLFRWLKRSQGADRIRALQSVAQTDPALRISPTDFDSDKNSLNVLNCSIDLNTGKSHPHSAEDYHSKVTNVEYDPDAECPLFEEVVRTAMNGDQKMIGYMRRFFGYCLTGHTDEQCLLYMLGLHGAEAKSTISEAIKTLLGDYAAVASIEAFLVRNRGDGPSPEIARLRGTRLVFVSESPQDRTLDANLIKTLTGGDTIVTRKLYCDPYEFVPQFKLVLRGNHRLDVRDTSSAMWRRFHILPFEVPIPKSKQDKKLLGKLKKEKSGILNWLIEGCLERRKKGLEPPEKAQKATASYRSDMDTLGIFLADCTKTKSGTRVKATTLYDAYKKWADESGERAVTQTKFGNAMIERGFERGRAKSGRYYEALWLRRL